MITLREVLIHHLRAMGADGLCNPYAECGCGLDDLAPLCECLNLDECIPARHVATSPESHAMYEEFPEGYYVPLLPVASFESERLWEAYQANQTYENCCRWLKHRAWMHLEGY